MEKVYEIPLTRGEVAIVDREDFEWLSQKKWHFNGRYATRSYRDSGIVKHVLMHRLIMGVENKNYKEVEVDHINKIKLDNRRDNLRLCNSTENKRNSNSKKSKNTNVKYRGIKPEYGDKWSVLIRIGDGKRIKCGTFTNEIAAANCYNYYANMHHGEFAILNTCPFMEMEEWKLFLAIPHLRNKEDGKYKNKFKSKYIGVSYIETAKGIRWAAFLTYNKKHIRIGSSFSTELEAAKAYNQKALELKGDKAKLNNLEEENV